MITILRAMALCAALLISSQASAEQYPTKAVKIIIPFPAGGVTDIATRLIAQKLSERNGQQFYVENIPGAGGNTGIGNAARQRRRRLHHPDHVLGIVVNPNLYAKVPYDIDKDFIPITKAGGTPNSWVVNADHPAKTMKELIDLFKKEPGKHTVGSPGAGTTPSLSIEMLKHALNLDFITVPFAGGGPMTTAAARRAHAGGLLGARQLCQPAQGGQAARRSRSPPRSARLRCPTSRRLDELGIKGQEAETMTGVFVPAGTPKDDRRKAAPRVRRSGARSDIKAKLLQAGVEAEGNSQAEFAAYIKARSPSGRR